jgi:hypothetical protein
MLSCKQDIKVAFFPNTLTVIHHAPGFVLLLAIEFLAKVVPTANGSVTERNGRIIHLLSLCNPVQLLLYTMRLWEKVVSIALSYAGCCRSEDLSELLTV